MKDEDFMASVEAPPEPTTSATPAEPSAPAAPAASPVAASTPSTPAAPAAEPKPAAATPEAPVGATPQVPATPPATPVAAEPPPPFSVELEQAPAAQPTAQAPTARLTPEQLVERLTAEYQFDEQTREALLDDAPAALPRILAQQHVRMAQEVVATIAKVLPSIVQNMMQQGATRQTFTQKFYGKWPGLRQHHAFVDKALKTYRALNPGLTLDELVQQVGLHASVALKLPIEGVTPPQAPAPAPTAFTPASPGGGGSPPPPTPNVWDQFIEEA